MTLQASGAISINDINNEFNLGTNLNLYRGQQWFRDFNAETGNFSSGTLAMSEFYSKRKDDPMPRFEYLGVINLGDTAVSGSRTITIPLGTPGPTRRIVLYHVCDYQSGPTATINLAQSCTIGSTPTVRYGAIAEGTALTVDYSYYTSRENVFVSDIIADGTSATLTYSCNARTAWRRMCVASVTKIINPSLAYRGAGPYVTIFDAPAGTIFFALSGAGATAYTNATLRVSYSGIQATCAQGDFQNTFRGTATRTFIANTGNIRIYSLR